MLASDSVNALYLDTEASWRAVKYSLTALCNNVNATYLVFALLLILIDFPSLSVIAVGHFVWADKLNVAKVFSPLGDDSCNLGGH